MGEVGRGWFGEVFGGGWGATTDDTVEDEDCTRKNISNMYSTDR